MKRGTAILVCVIVCICISLCLSATGGGSYYYYDKYIKTQAPTAPASSTPAATSAPAGTIPASSSTPAATGAGSSVTPTPTTPPMTSTASTATPTPNTATMVSNPVTPAPVTVNAPTPPTLSNQPLQCMTRVLDCAGGTCNENNALQLYAKNGNPGQNFTMNADGTITSNGRCITVSSDNRSVTMVSPNHTGQQLWRWVWNATTNAWNLQNQSNNFYLEAIGSQDGNGTGIDVIQTATAVGQQWLPTTPGTPATPTLTGQALQPGPSTTRVLDCNSASTILKTNNGSAGQGFTFNSNGTITSGGNCLTVGSDNQTITLGPCSGSASQNWSWVWNGAGWGLKNQGSGNMLDVANGTDADGTSVRAWGANGATAQQWTPVNQVAPPPPAPTLNNQPLKIMTHVLDCAGGTCATGTNSQLYDNNGSPGQLWTLNSDNTISNPASGKILSVNGGATANGSAIHTWDNVNGPDQKWQFLYAGNNNWQMQNVQSGRCIDAAGASDTDGAQLQLWDCPTSGTHWVSPTTQNKPTLNNQYAVNQSRTLTCQNGGCGSNSNLVIYDKNNGINQKFTFNGGSGPGTITNNNLCLDNLNGTNADGNRVRMYGCNGLAPQQWQWQHNTNGTWSFVNPATGKCLDVQNATDANNTTVRLFSCNQQPSQKWFPG